MQRPETVEDVLALVRLSRVVEEARLNCFLEQLRETGTSSSSSGGAAVAGLTPAALLGLLVEQGLLTRYQSNELAAGRSGLWIGGFLILDLLGRGGMGQVYLAEHALLGKRVALKVLPNGDCSDEAGRKQFLLEARAAAALDHPNIVRVLDVNVAHDPPYLVMEYVDGISLQAAVVRHGTFTAGETAAVGVEVAMGLQQVSEVGLVHRDIKPANILVDRKGGVKILDLGIARFTSDPISKLVDTESLIGTLDYLAPEQAIDSSLVDSRADLYALGATLFFLLAGHPPFADDELTRKLVRKQQSNPPPIAALRLDVPAGLAEVIDRLLARSASDRYPTPAEAARALKPWASREPEFPDRLFHPWHVAEAPVQPADSGSDPSPTPLPPTRRILRAQTERRTSVRESLPDTTPSPTSKPWRPCDETVPSEPLFIPDPAANESGSPTETRSAPPVRKPWSNLIIGLLALGAIGAALLARWFGS